MGASQSRSKPKPTHTTIQEHKAAGCVFTNGSLVLAGYQPKKKNPVISGLGGGRKKGELPITTAIRETLEELFHINIKKIPHDLLIRLQRHPSEKIVWNGSYVMYVYSFQQLEEILGFCIAAGITSPLYTTLPTTLTDLLLNRKPHPQGKAEVSHLCLLPLVNHISDYPFVYPGFLRDMRLLLQKADHQDLLTV